MPQLHTTDLNSAGQNLSESVKKRLIYRKAFDHEIYMGCPLDYLSKQWRAHPCTLSLEIHITRRTTPTVTKATPHV